MSLIKKTPFTAVSSHGEERFFFIRTRDNRWLPGLSDDQTFKPHFSDTVWILYAKWSYFLAAQEGAADIERKAFPQRRLYSVNVCVFCVCTCRKKWNQENAWVSDTFFYPRKNCYFILLTQHANLWILFFPLKMHRNNTLISFLSKKTKQEHSQNRITLSI